MHVALAGNGVFEKIGNLLLKLHQ